MTHTDPGKLCVSVTNPADDSRERELALTLGVEIAEVTEWMRTFELALAFENDTLSLLDRDSKGRNGVAVTFEHLSIRHGRVQVSRNQPLAKAFGDHVETVVDATAGLGRDAFMLAALGYDITGIERSPVLFALLQNGLDRALADGRLRQAVEGHIRFVHADAIDWLPTCEPRPDAVYIDPMFPPKRKKSALAKKSIRLVRALVGDDPDVDQLVDAALRTATRRVIIKRPDDAPPLLPRPIASYTGKLVRYDAYAARGPLLQASITLE